MSLRVRAVIALSLMAGFYLLAIALSLFLLWLPYGSYAYLGFISLKLDLFCLILGPVILWSIIPRRDRFDAPGPKIDLQQHPKLATELAKISTAMQQSVPAEVYVSAEVNAGVLQRGGFLGMGSRRVMVLGLPLMRLLTVSEFRAVLCHEFGHYYAGDTKLAPFVYRTRIKILRMVLATRQTILAHVFVAYANFFNRVTLKISRAQELAADRMAAQFMGGKALIEGLKRIHEAGNAWTAYVQFELAPVVNAGFAPSVSEGFSQFIQAPHIQKVMTQNLQAELAEGKSNAMDSHPPLRERISMIENFAAAEEDDSSPASDLLEGFDRLDLSLALQQPGTKLQPIAWDEVLEKIHLPIWTAQVERQHAALEGLTAMSLSDQLTSGELVDRIKNPEGVWPTRAEKQNLTKNVASCALALGLYRDNWIFHFGPGKAYCEKAENRLEPFPLVAKLFSRDMKREEWLQLCEVCGISQLQLAPEATAASA